MTSGLSNQSVTIYLPQRDEVLLFNHDGDFINWVMHEHQIDIVDCYKQYCNFLLNLNNNYTINIEGVDMILMKGVRLDVEYSLRPPEEDSVYVGPFKVVLNLETGQSTVHLTYEEVHSYCASCCPSYSKNNMYDVLKGTRRLYNQFMIPPRHVRQYDLYQQNIKQLQYLLEVGDAQTISADDFNTANKHFACAGYKKFTSSGSIMNGFPLVERTSDEKIIYEAVKLNGLALQHASNEWKSNYKIVLQAVKQNVVALQYASDELKSKDYLGVLIRDVLIPLKYTFLSTILYRLSPCYEDKQMDDISVSEESKNMTRKQKRNKSNSNNYFDQSTLQISSTSLSIQKLNGLGEEGLLAFKKDLAEYLGINISLELMEKALGRLLDL
mmetsp:Transcript_17230/g.20292  ORF Transcript_17230/g.20292 Transcript_17230/m.20292 type:complete len:383 (-) Transcript_17230:222-1370(-)|eukprot:CAMPEP_0114345104 /NCGR_PEP_ID=MMETSP0101-20121206/11953_1 /TAXON_ID=38822 ORGANISM="Pteridomonas danica, Strain PT" /NCGR_SAMPLE_ID=MMETSP0101 /ASSEMBLY_ACC=CAM_ASM_000211 /LENGTH=382 /DNA_ID=CAMNT_0001480853 /DNA_START=55 /DNA_END=1203 /DNA_ORIENTATION=-